MRYRESSARAHKIAMGAEEREVRSWDLDDSVTIGMHSIRCDRIRLTAGAGRSRVCGRIPRHIGKRQAGIRGPEKRTCPSCFCRRN